MSLEIVPLSLREANSFVSQYHWHHGPLKLHKYAVGVADGGELVVVAIRVAQGGRQ